MNVYNLIFKKREGGSLSPEEMSFIVSGFLNGEVPDYQMSAFLMSVFYKGMTTEELNEFTRIMLESGDVIDLSSLGMLTVDKHSTGGVGDGVSLSLAPLAASFGVAVPMMSGRGLGHTGGTLDKLESIEGFSVSLTKEQFLDQLGKINVAMIGQTENIAPADKKMYALRDVTATVDSIELISASIMSKKLAEGAESLVLDVKTGSGAFMRETGQARELARRMIDIGSHYGRNMTAVISNMDQPLGSMIGNALEIQQAVDIMSGGGPDDIVDLTAELCGHMLVMSGICSDIEDGRKKAAENLSNGRALEKFAMMVKMQGGNPEVCEDPSSVLPSASGSYVVKARQTGYITGMDTRQIGMSALVLGAGRKSVSDTLDYSAGIEVLKKIGDRVEKDEPLAKM